MTKLTGALLILILITPSNLQAQSSASDVREDLLGHFSRSSSKMTRLSAAVPAELYTWSPGEGTMSVARVYAHIARYNYYYLETSLGIAAPESVNLDAMENTVDKRLVELMLRESVAHVKKHVGAMSEEDLNRQVTLYGRQVDAWQVLTQLVSHMNEHVGQSVAYARINGITPPWSR